MTRHRVVPDSDHRVVAFRPRPSSPPKPPVEGLQRYEHGNEAPGEYRHRMIANALAFGFVVLLVIGGAWLADRMVSLRQDQDCALQGRRNCAAVHWTAGNR